MARILSYREAAVAESRLISSADMALARSEKSSMRPLKYSSPAYSGLLPIATLRQEDGMCAGTAVVPRHSPSMYCRRV